MAEPLSPSDSRHGKNAGYIAGCSEQCCREAHAAYRRDLRTRQYLHRGPLMVSALGTHRRIQALMALGWTGADIDAALGRRPTYSVNVLRNREQVVSSTVEAFARVYDELSGREPNTDGTRAQVVARTKRLAERRGWHPPEAWIDIDDPHEDPAAPVDLDEVVVLRVLAGEWGLSTTRREREEVVARWRAQGRSLGDLERLTGWNVTRYYTPDRRQVA